MIKQIDFREEEAKEIIRKILLAVHHMHTKGIVHRDLKPENVMYVSKEDNSDIKIIDFGLSNTFEITSSLKSTVGTPSYISP